MSAAPITQSLNYHQIFTVHHGLGATLAKAVKVDPENITEDGEQLVEQAVAESPVRNHVACTLLAAVVTRDFAGAIAQLTRTAAEKMEELEEDSYQHQAWNWVLETLGRHQ